MHKQLQNIAKQAEMQKQLQNRSNALITAHSHPQSVHFDHASFWIVCHSCPLEGHREKTISLRDLLNTREEPQQKK